MFPSTPPTAGLLSPMVVCSIVVDCVELLESLLISVADGFDLTGGDVLGVSNNNMTSSAVKPTQTTTATTSHAGYSCSHAISFGTSDTFVALRDTHVATYHRCQGK